jgi:hypothetical protein
VHQWTFEGDASDKHGKATSEVQEYSYSDGICEKVYKRGGVHGFTYPSVFSHPITIREYAWAQISMSLFLIS